MRGGRISTGRDCVGFGDCGQRTGGQLNGRLVSLLNYYAAKELLLVITLDYASTPIRCL
jgi:hypothetical protein